MVILEIFLSVGIFTLCSFRIIFMIVEFDHFAFTVRCFYFLHFVEEKKIPHRQRKGYFIESISRYIM